MLSFVVSTLVVLGTFQAEFTNGDLSSEFANSAVLDEAATVTLYWSVNWDSKTVSFAVEALTTGWVGFGISTGRGQMIGADIVIGGVADDGKHYFMVSLCCVMTLQCNWFALGNVIKFSNFRN